MRKVLKFLFPVVTIALAACQQFGGQSPYEYRFVDSAAQEVCVSVTPHGNESLRLSVRQLLREQGFKVREVKTFDDSCTRCLKFDFSVGAGTIALSRANWNMFAWCMATVTKRMQARNCPRLPSVHPVTMRVC